MSVRNWTTLQWYFQAQHSFQAQAALWVPDSKRVVRKLSYPNSAGFFGKSCIWNVESPQKKGCTPLTNPSHFAAHTGCSEAMGKPRLGAEKFASFFYPGMMIEGAVETTVTSLKLLCLLGRIFVISAKTRALKTFARSRSRLQSLLVDSNTKSWWKCIETLIDVGWFGGLCRIILSSIDYRKFMCSGMIEFNTFFNSGAEGHAHGFRCGWLSCHPILNWSLAALWVRVTFDLDVSSKVSTPVTHLKTNMENSKHVILKGLFMGSI